MTRGCQLCNPVCGKCQPTPRKIGNCPTCKTCNIYARDEVLSGNPTLCKKCGADLSEQVIPKALLCNFSGLVCVYPCGRSVGEIPRFGYQTCMMNTAPQ